MEGTYRTKNRAKEVGDLDEIPKTLATITQNLYKNAITLNPDENAYIQPLAKELICNADNLEFENGCLFFCGLDATAAKLRAYFTNQKIEELNFPLLRVFYSIILNRYAKNHKENEKLDQVVTIYYPDLAKALGKSDFISSQSDIKQCIKMMAKFDGVYGIIDKGKRGEDILPIFQFMDTNAHTNTICFTSPYLIRIVKELYKTQETNTKKVKGKKQKSLPLHSYLIKTSIAKERNKKAVEIVSSVVVLIEQAGGYEAHIRASTLIDRNPLLKKAMEGKSTGNMNNQLMRAFSKAWELLNTQTYLRETYKNIELPDVTDPNYRKKWIPTSSSLDKVFVFKHEGKKKK